ncbi:MAG: T9SS type A sorting domain-containing protein [Candidatus Pseudobacter hemicellulosilyticus]|uniref:T9SS type A sorting domain-containing protein n=1 Tax=Candidatus Pseudobacter hemicellulosilyticus TaxID=3121375 RepID=A0AAJ5WPX7_9BACT|nr:MAG: T9SS type A sorting domain-containing protein [Pseudobacter sp.]
MRKTLPLQPGTGLPNLVRCLILLLTLFISLHVSANDYVVSNGANAGAGSLRQAILDANANAAGAPHTITFSVTGVINITSSLPTITRQVTIDGENKITISGPGGDNTVGLIVLGAGSGGSTVRNMAIRNTGLEPVLITAALSNITLQNLVFTQTGVHYANRSIFVNAASTNMTIKNVRSWHGQDNYQALYFTGAVTNLLIDSLEIANGLGAKGRGIHFQAAVNGFTLRNSTIDTDDPATADDGDYGIYFTTTATNVLIDSSLFRDNELYSIYVTGVANNFRIKNSRFDNLDGYTGATFVRFNSNVNTVLVDSCVFDADMRGSTNDGDYGLYMIGTANKNVTISNSVFNEIDIKAIYFGKEDGTNDHDNILIRGNSFTKNGSGTNGQGGIDFLARAVTGDAAPVLITENTFSDNNGNAILVRPGNATTYVLPNFTISKNIIYNTKTSNGAIRTQWNNKVIITQNSIYNNQGLGIENSTANCNYEGANTPQILSSAETSTGVYTVVVKMPAICGTGNCSLELFSNEAGIKGSGGQHYVTTRTGLSSGNNTLTGITGSFSEIQAAPYGFWTATLKLNNNCGTSEFGARMAIRPNGPAGVNAGITLWLRGEDISVAGAEPASTGQVITGWEEFSGGGGPGATTVWNNPLTKLNGINFNPVADIDGDMIRGHIAGTPVWLSTNTSTSVAVFNPLSASAAGDRYYVLYAQGSWDYNNNKGKIEFHRNGANSIAAHRGGTALHPVIPGTTGVTAFNKAGLFTAVTNGNVNTGYYNAANMGTTTIAGKGNFAITQWFIGGSYGPNANGQGTWQYMAETDFAEVFTYNRELTPLELQKVQSYMAMKYGIAMKSNYILSSGTPVWDVTANAAFSKEIAALVRDNLSVLHQRQARASLPDEVVSISMGAALAATNKDNADSIANNLSAFIWGNDSTAATFSTAFSAGEYSNLRMTRRWKVKKTNWSDHDITFSLQNGKDNNFLLISTDPTFATITRELRLSKTGTVTINSADIPDGAYFSFGREQRKPGGVLNGLVVWTKADEGVLLSGTAVTNWIDDGPSQRDWYRNNGNAITVLPVDMNYNPSLRIAGNNYFRSASLFTNAYTAGEIFSVQSSAVNNVASFPYQLGGTSAATAVHYRWTDNNMYLHWGTNARRAFSFGTKNMALPAILNINTAANSWTASLDARVMLGPSAFTTSLAQVSSAPTNYIGAGHSSVFNGSLSEVIMYNRKLTATERLQVNSYVALKYGITLDQTTATDYLASDGVVKIWDAAANGIYKNNITGIGLDSNGTLEQKQSRSINTAASGNLIAMAVGNALAISNAENTDTITNDRSFLVWADNAGAITYTSNVSGDRASLRMPRVWKVDKTNWSDRNITLKLFSGASNTYLLISNADASFATIDQELLLNADSTLTINSDLLPDGAYFTFAKEIRGPGFVNSGVTLWLRADDELSGGDTWYDYSGNDMNAVQPTIANQALLQNPGVNFNPAYQFDGTDDYMDFTANLGLINANPFTVVGIGMRSSISTWDAWLSMQNTSPAGGFLHGISNANTVQLHKTNTGAIATGTNLVTTLNYPYLSTGTRTGNNFALYLNGKADGTVTSTQTFTVGNMRLGNRNASADLAFHGRIPEVIVYNRALSTLELNRVQSYLALKYGVSLDQATATDYVSTDWDGTAGARMWTASKNTGYAANIAGIGRDDKTALLQKQSCSYNDTTITISVGTTVEASNAANAGQLDDLAFFTWADNNLATTFSVAVTSVTQTTSRMARVWKVDRTNWSDQDITFKIPLGGERFLLVHESDPTFGDGAKEFAINTSNGTVTINSSELPDGAFFSLGTKIVGPACVNNGIAAWLRTDYAAYNHSWVDFSGSQTNAAQATAASQPVLVDGGLNYNPALRFDGSNDFMQITQADINGKFSFGNNARTIIGVGVSVASTDQSLFTYGTFVNNQSSGFRKSATLEAVFEANAVANNVTGAAGTWPNNKIVQVSGRYTGGTTGTASLFVNGVSSLTSATRNWNTLISAQGAQVGKYIGENRYYNGTIGEVIVYNRNLTDDEFLRVSSYLAIKYGITLNQATATDYMASDGATRMWTAASNVAYNRRITGIGRDDCTQLYQKQSISVDTGLVALAIGDSLQVSNTENIYTIDNDNAYFFIADNGAATTYTTTLNGLDPLTTRMDRIWKVQKTNWTEADVNLKLTGGNQQVYLVVSDDETFDGADAMYPLNGAGSVTIGTNLIPDGAYFTFAKAINGPGFVNIGVQLWLRADDETITGEVWPDYSGNGADAEQTDGGKQAVNTAGAMNYNPAMRFDGTNDFFSVPYKAAFNQNITVFSVHRQTAGSGWRSPITSRLTGSPNRGWNYYHNVLGREFWTGAASWSVQTGGTYVANTPELIGFDATLGSGNSVKRIYLNGATAASVANANYVTNTSAPLYVGSMDASTYFWNGDIVESIVYNRVISVTERQIVESYLGLKYGFTLSAGTRDYLATDSTVYWNATLNSTNNKNIAGIGRDDRTGLYQKQSRSSNTTANGNMVAIALNELAATNQQNDGELNEDKTFLVWGDNGLTGFQNTDFPGELNPGSCSKITRLQREWKVQQTGSVNSVQLSMFLAGVVPNSTGISDLKLLVDDDGNFENGGTSIIDPSSYDVSTQTATFDNLTFTTGQYFTLVTDLTNQAPGGVINDLFTWHRADKGVTTNGTTISGWSDQGALTPPRDLTATTQPGYNTTTNLINFNPSFNHTGTQWLQNTALGYSTTAAAGEDLFAVVLPNTATGNQTVIGMGTVANSSTVTELRYNAGRLQYVVNGTSLLSVATSNGRVQLANVHRLSGAASLRIDGQSVNSSTGTLVAVPALTQLNIGATRSAAANNQFFNGRIAEVAVYKRQLTAEERERVASYFGIKYGLTLPHDYVDPNGTVQWDAGDNVGYGYNITGIGRDDCNGLHQKQSRSINSGEALVTLGNGSEIAVTNAANTNVMSNNTALLLGDNNGNRTAFVALGAPAGRERIARTWKVQETGAVGTVLISVPASTSSEIVKLPAERNGVLYMLVNNSNDFSIGAQEIPMTLNGDTWEASYDFNSGDYFTFATNDACVASEALLTNYDAETTAATDKCYVNGWILFRDPADAGKYIAAIYDPNGLIDRTKITASVDVNGSFADLGKANPAKASRLMRRLLQVNCASCFNAGANPSPNFTVRMFYSTDEKGGADAGETNSMEDLKAANALTDPTIFKWFKANEVSAHQVISGLKVDGIAAVGMEWLDGELPVGQVDGIDYIDFTGINSFSVFGGIYLVNQTIALPVTWGNVQATPVKDQLIQVQWSTSMELNNAGFDVQRSEDEQSWTSIASVTGKENSNTVSHYIVEDRQVKAGVLYFYRIKQTDLDGRASYSRMVSASLRSTGILAEVVPNPVQNQLRLAVTANRQQSLQLQIGDAAGKILQQLKVNAVPGRNLFTSDVSRLTNGTYYLRIITADGTVLMKRFVVQRGL